MPQETNLNVSPYFDDFDREKDYYKVLFKPGYPIQARELTSLQSILQNQIEQFGTHFFKEGDKIIPGQLTYLKDFYCIQVNSEYAGIPLSLYSKELIGKKIRGATSGVKAEIKKIINETESERNTITLYLNYLESGLVNSQKEFTDGEILLTEDVIQFGNNFISIGEPFAIALSLNSTSIGSAISISNGVYFLRGYFVNINDEIILLEQYSNNPSCRVGFYIEENIVSSDEDLTLTDNAKGFNNYAAPGADRLKIRASLYKKNINDLDNTNFVQLITIKDGLLRDNASNLDNSYLNDILANRTFDESGHYYVKPFTIYVKESLNNGIGNDGIFKENELTYNGSSPSDDLAIYKISPGQAYVRGYSVGVPNPTFLDIQKPRTTETLENQGINFGFGPTISVNRVYGSPTIGFNTTGTLLLKNDRIGVSSSTESGETIGIARIYDFALESGSYNTNNLNQNVWDLSLFDVQLYSTATLNEPVTLSLPTRIIGQSSGATAFLRSAVTNSSTISLYEIKGQFSSKENIIFDCPIGTENNRSRVITDIRNYGISDVKSIYSTPGIGITFNADVIQSSNKVIGNASISAPVANICTVTFSGANISGIFLPGNLVSYTNPTINTISYARVFSVDEISREIQITDVADVLGVVNGALPTNILNVNDFTLLVTSIQNVGSNGNAASNESLFSILPKSNIKSVNLSNSQLTIRRQFKVNITNNSTNPIDSGENEVFLPFDEERYTLIRSNGSTEILTQDKFTYSNGSSRLVINNLSANDIGSILIATLTKSKVKSKSKIKKVIESIIIDKSKYAFSGIGQSTSDDGLIHGNYPYGTRVQDTEICLNYPDVNILYGIFESSDVSDPQIPFIVLSSLNGLTATTNDLTIGEEIIGTTSGARAIYVEKINDVEIGFIGINDYSFIQGESITFKKTGVSAVISIINFGSKNISKEFNLITGQTSTYYDYSKIVRNSNSPEPQRKIKVIFTRGYYDSSDTGDITTVDSYNSFEYNGEITNINGTRVTDIIDFRPRVSDYVVAQNIRSPFEFLGRSFNNSNHSSKYVISPDESIVLSYSYYLPRIDRIYLTKDGIFSIKVGSPSNDPKIPEEVSGAMNIANVYLPAYLYNSNDAKVEFVQHKRYQMKDIYNLENRIKNLEYYTTLSLLETNTSNLFIDDGTGLNRFKSGFFVDNFKSLTTQDLSVGVKNSIDIKNGTLRPSHYTTELSLEISNSTIAGIGTATTSNQDKKYSAVLGSNIKRTGNVITLDYSQSSWLKQPFATRMESVTPFFIRLWEGSINLHPTTDNWIDVNQLSVYNVQIEGSFLGVSEALNAEITTNSDGSRSGVAPVIWNSWETTGINVDVSYSSVSGSVETIGAEQLRQGTASEFEQFTGQRGNGVPNTFLVGTQQIETTNTTTTTNNTSVTLNQSRTGSQKFVTEQINTESFGNRIVNRDIIQFMRSRNIEFTSKKMKPYTQVYPFFDGVNVSDFCFSKLIEIKMNSGIFSVGETVIGVMPGQLLTLSSTGDSALAKIFFRVATLNHKYGPYNRPTDIFDGNPYDRNNNMPSAYSSTSTIINIDTFSLSEDTENIFYGNIKKEMKLYGTSSGAEATVTDVRLFTDRLGTLIGSYLVPNGNISSNPKFETGKSRFRLTSSSTNSQIGGEVATVAEESFFSQGQIDNKQETTLSVRNARVETLDNFVQTNTLSSSDSAISSVSSSTSVSSRLTGVYRDPLAQSFTVDDPTGIFVTKLDLYFSTKDESIPVTVQIREVELGVPNQRILPFSEVELSPDKINISNDASIATTFEFDSPVYLEGQREYAIIIISNSTEYNVWISRLGESDIATLGAEQNQILVTTQRLLGSLFKSQNASTWTPSQYEDLTFELYKADFVNSGFTQFFNPELPNSLQIMKKDPLTIISNKVTIGLSSSVLTSDLTIGNTVFQTRSGLSSATGNLVGFAGSSFGALNVVSPGIGYTGSSYTYNNVSLRNITGTGINATATIVINGGGATSATIVNGGYGYVVGDVLEPVSIGSQNLGIGMRLSVSSVTNKSQLILDNVQGIFEQNRTNAIQYVNDSGVTNFIEGGGVYIVSPPQVINDGRHIKVFHRNHGMHSSSNSVIIKDISSDISPVPLTATCNSNATQLLVENSDIFATFEGSPVSSVNLGYVKILNEIISYSNITPTSLIGITKGRDNTTSFSYPIGSFVEKYELNGVSLRRINKTHKLSDATEPTIKDRIGPNHYYINIDMSANGGNRNRSLDLKFSKTAQVGGANGKATYNIPFEIALPNISYISPTGTDVRMSLRTMTGTSLGGNQVSFVDCGFQDILNNKLNYFNSSRVIASKINETEKLTNLPGNKSLNLNMYMSTNDSRISPVIDLGNCKMVFTSNVINNPITNYSTDYRVNTLKDDPNLFTYVTNPIELETSASSIKLILDAYISNTSDIRALYSIGKNGDTFIPFPGYNNINVNGSVVDIASSDGNPDIKVPKTDIYTFEANPSAFREYQFTIDGLESFKIFRIKLIATSENQSNVPIIKNLRAIALASLKRDY
jgi:hypothetical protein